jgi:hypothetical protein
MAVANVATQPDALRQPVVALKWAESIVDPKLRVRVTASIVNEWATADPIAARNFAENAGSFRSEERAELLSALEPGFNPVSLLP